MLALILIALLPLAALAVYSSWQLQQSSRLQAHVQTLSLGRLAADSAGGFARQVIATLSTLAKDPALVSQDPEDAREHLSRELASGSLCTNIWAARADGLVYADPQVDPAAPPRSIADQRYFQQAMQSGQVSYQTVRPGGAADPRVLLVFAVPVAGSDGRAAGTVQASFEPSRIDRLVPPGSFPPGASVTLIDPQRTIIVQTRDPRRWLGRTLPDAQAASALRQRETTWEGTFLGESCVMGSAVVDRAPWQAIVAIPSGRALAAWQATLWRAALLFAGALAVALYLGSRVTTLGSQGWEQSTFLWSLLDSAPIGIAVVAGPENRLELANPVFRLAIERREEPLAGRPLRELLPEPTARAAQDDIAEAHRSGQTVTVREAPLEVGRPPRTDYWDLDYVPLPATRRRTRALLLLATPVTEKVRARQEMEELARQTAAQARQFQAILAAISESVWLFDADGNVQFINDATARQLGVEPAPEVLAKLSDLGRTVDLFRPDGTPIVGPDRHLARALRGETLVGEEFLFRPPGGGPLRWTRASAAPVRDREGRIVGAVFSASDVTEQKEAQAERERLLAQVESARRNLRAILDRLPDAVLVVDASQRVTLSNDTIRRHLGYDPVGVSLPDLHRRCELVSAGGQPFPEGESPFERAVRGETVIGAEVGMQLADGRRADLLVSAAPLRAPDGTVREVALVLTDVTPLKELDRAKDQFFSVAAHELRTPLTSLRGHAQILLRRAERAGWRPEDRHSLQTIDEQVQRLNDLIGRLLDVSRIRLGKLQLHREPTDIVALARKAARDLQVTTEAHRITVEAELPQIVGFWDSAALRQVLTNLIGNAIKYTPGGPIDVRVWRQDGEALVSVSDRGPGIPPERQAWLFEPFTRGAAREYREAGGLGLGLFICRGIVEAHGGHIWVESQVGVGTTFTFSLPLGTQGQEVAGRAS